MLQVIKRSGWLIFLFLIISQLTFALPTQIETTDPIRINADSTFFNYKTGKNAYEGNVKLTQGGSLLTADRIITQNNSHHKLEQAIAYGLTQLAEYANIPKNQDLPFSAKAKVIKFYPLTSTIILEGNVIVKQGENSFQGPIIIYNTKDQTISAPASEGGRATIVIESKSTKS